MFLMIVRNLPWTIDTQITKINGIYIGNINEKKCDFTLKKLKLKL